MADPADRTPPTDPVPPAEPARPAEPVTEPRPAATPAAEKKSGISPVVWVALAAVVILGGAYLVARYQPVEQADEPFIATQTPDSDEAGPTFADEGEDDESDVEGGVGLEAEDEPRDPEAADAADADPGAAEPIAAGESDE